jgi:hypothetical protein
MPAKAEPDNEQSAETTAPTEAPAVNRRQPAQIKRPKNPQIEFPEQP